MTLKSLNFNKSMDIWYHGRPPRFDNGPIWRGEIANLEEPATILAYKPGFLIHLLRARQLTASFIASVVEVLVSLHVQNPLASPTIHGV